MYNSYTITTTLIFLIPTIIGSFIYILSYFKENEQKLKLDLPHLATALAHAFVYGALIIFFQSSLLTKYFPNQFEIYFTWAIALELVIGLIATITIILKKRNYIELQLNDLKIVVLLFVLTLIGYGIWRWNSPTTATLDWDMFMHQSAVNLIREGKFNFDTLKISDTFKFYSYPPMFHTVVLAGQIFLKNIAVPEYWWFAQFWHYFATIVASYTLGYAVTRKKTVGIISAIIGAFVFESFIAYTSLFLIPQTLAGIMLTLFIAGEILRFHETRKIIELATIATVSYLVLNHMVIGFAGITIIMLSIVYLRLFRDKGRIGWHRILTVLAILSLPGLYYLSQLIDLSFLNRGEAVHFTLSLSEKFNYMREFYGYFLLLLFPIGLLHIFRKKPQTNETLNLLIALGTLAVVTSTFPYALKFYTIGRYFVHVVMAIGFWSVIENLPKYLKYLLIGIFGFSLLIVFAINTNGFKENIIHNGIASHISLGEYEAAKYIGERYKNQNVLLISDPTTMHIMEGVSKINTPGGAFTDTKTRQLVSRIYFSRDSDEMRNVIMSARDTVESQAPEKVLLAISGRFSKWQLSSEAQKIGIILNIWKPSNLGNGDLDFIDFIDRNVGFEKVYNSPSIVIYEIK